ncbi:MAG TPA: 2-oxoglutarate dehydrogenase, E2 component, dihydrolipoamide succinyltransferase, partial [Candidatus Edwardsbacteria bacterium]|nr:2-oxoglutarate dehydrogenase, E2 component, dihydrolipoamide succinyltransferase [Candidatus Edwardsbacteria bacterium]
ANGAPAASAPGRQRTAATGQDANPGSPGPATPAANGSQACCAAGFQHTPAAAASAGCASRPGCLAVHL